MGPLQAEDGFPTSIVASKGSVSGNLPQALSEAWPLGLLGHSGVDLGWNLVQQVHGLLFADRARDQDATSLNQPLGKSFGIVRYGMLWIAADTAAGETITAARGRNCILEQLSQCS